MEEIQLTLVRHGFTLHWSTNTEIFFFSKYSQPILLTGFVSMDSTNHRSKTVFSHSQLWTEIVFHLQLVESVDVKGILYSQKLTYKFSPAGKNKGRGAGKGEGGPAEGE